MSEERLDKIKENVYTRCNIANFSGIGMTAPDKEELELLEEIERLNNIISELERKMLNDKLYIEDISKKQPYPIEEFRIRNPYTTGIYDTCVNYLGKIKELKGDDKE